jgi:alcohol dehydrogenase
VAIDYADINLVRLPENLDFVTAASLGCRFVTSFRAIVDQGKVSAGQWVAVHGCGGVGLSAIMIANALGANAVAIDISDEKLDFAKSIGADATINATTTEDVVANVLDITKGGAHISIDALGNTVTCFNSVANLRKRGKHVQVGLMLADQRHPSVPMDKVIANELEILGSHGIQAHKYPVLLAMIQAKKLRPEILIGKTISLEESLEELINMNNFGGTGVTVINEF